MTQSSTVLPYGRKAGSTATAARTEDGTATAARTEDDVEALRAEVECLRRQNSDLQGRLRTHPAIALAQGILIERYGLPEPDQAFALMRHVSQRANIKLHQLADALNHIPGPDTDARLWFPRRVPATPPPLHDVDMELDGGANQGAVLGAALRRVLTIAGTDMGNVQLADRSGLRMEKHTGLTREFTDFFAFVDGPTTSCSQAAADQEQVTVRDVATAEMFDEDSRRTILEAGSRACHSVPIIDGQSVRGMVSSHHARPLAGFSRPQLQALEATGQAVGRWLTWHHDTVIHDALEELHGLARTTR
ncbi:GAF and ANTAR domain-containing protein [Streptomyces agglomeratus]|uniref:GAF and ANTAR domain-containing protein n=1 Tax=Streptomyces agglomeratus TaxID=285458 RepID=UPI0009A05ADC|nr:ANTAR domain-containing protein [Streptomyces agglomeratus]